MERMAPRLVALISAGTALYAFYTRHTRSIARLLVIAEQSEKETHGAYQKHSHDTSSGAVLMRQKTFELRDGTLAQAT